VLGIPGVGYSEHMEVSPVGWRDLGRQVSALAYDVRRTTGAEPLVVGMDRYATASELAFYASDRQRSVANTTSSHLFGGSGLMYEQWFPRQQLRGRTLLLVALKPQDVAAPGLESHGERLEAPREGILLRHGESVHRFYYRVVFGYR
jgi:dolichol-phosphate mannosyltransferase